MRGVEPELHPDLTPLAFLLGTWRGEGTGDYPTIDAFAYLEEVTFGHVGKPFISYSQRTRDATSQLPLHAESGYLRPGADGAVELVVAQPSGIVEVDEGTVEDQRIDLRSVIVHGSTTAKEVSQVLRRIEVSGVELSYEVDMAAVGRPIQFHLRATLHRE